MKIQYWNISTLDWEDVITIVSDTTMRNIESANLYNFYNSLILYLISSTISTATA